MVRIKWQIQVINDDKGWLQRQQLSPAQVGDQTATIFMEVCLGKCRLLQRSLKSTNEKYCVQNNAHKISIYSRICFLLLCKILTPMSIKAFLTVKIQRCDFGCCVWPLVPSTLALPAVLVPTSIRWVASLCHSLLLLRCSCFAASQPYNEPFETTANQIFSFKLSVSGIMLSNRKVNTALMSRNS